MMLIIDGYKLIGNEDGSLKLQVDVKGKPEQTIEVPPAHAEDFEAFIGGCAAFLSATRDQRG